MFLHMYSKNKQRRYITNKNINLYLKKKVISFQNIKQS